MVRFKPVLKLGSPRACPRGRRQCSQGRAVPGGEPDSPGYRFEQGGLGRCARRAVRLRVGAMVLPGTVPSLAANGPGENTVRPKV
jgi:hypothetical protein